MLYLAAVDKSENQVQFLGCLEREFEVDDEWVVDLCQYIALGNGVLNFITLDDVGLDALEKIQLSKKNKSGSAASRDNGPCG